VGYITDSIHAYSSSTFLGELLASISGIHMLSGEVAIIELKTWVVEFHEPGE
jgi:hypothetical protein